MFYLLYGTDVISSRKKLNSLIEVLLSKKKDASLLKVNEENFDEDNFSEYTESQGLFESKSIIVFDFVFNNKEYKSIVLKNVKELAISKNVFIILEEKIDKKTLNKMEKYAEKVQEFSLKENKKENKFNIFEISDALGERNKKKTWVLYQMGRRNSISNEEIHGILFWGIKNMIITRNCKTQKESGLSPFVFRKANQFAKNYSENELQKLSSNLIDIYHNARRGVKPLDIELEKFTLNI